MYTSVGDCATYWTLVYIQHCHLHFLFQADVCTVLFITAATENSALQRYDITERNGAWCCVETDLPQPSSSSCVYVSLLWWLGVLENHCVWVFLFLFFFPFSTSKDTSKIHLYPLYRLSFLVLMLRVRIFCKNRDILKSRHLFFRSGEIRFVICYMKYTWYVESASIQVRGILWSLLCLVRVVSTKVSYTFYDEDIDPLYCRSEYFYVLDLHHDKYGIYTFVTILISL